MELNLLQITFLAALQGLTEYLPISSSGHLLLPGLLWSWPDQGLVFDVAVHVGSLLAVAVYFHQTLWSLAGAAWRSVWQRENSADSQLAWWLVLATLPAGIAGILLNDWIEQYARALPVLATTSIVFGGLLWWSDRFSRRHRTLADLTWRDALLIGCAQVLALIPGTSRSGITMTAGLGAHLDRSSAARFSFLLAVPIIAASGLLKTLDLLSADAAAGAWLQLGYGVLVSAAVSFACIHYFLRLIERVGFLPFVIYRVLLGLFLLGLHFA